MPRSASWILRYGSTGRCWNKLLRLAAGCWPWLKPWLRLDLYAALAEVALMNRYVRPQLLESEDLHIVAGRHPVVEVTQREEPFVPNDVHFSPEEAILIITGPNMAGKSTYLRQVALIVLMAQIGSFVPADEARIGLVDRIFTRIGAQDEISAGQSTFMVEMVETANLLNHATSRSLLVLDEVGRGTSTYDGISIAWAVVEHIHNHPRLRCKTLFATHYHELTQLSELLPHIRNYNVAVAEEKGQGRSSCGASCQAAPTGAMASTWLNWLACRRPVIHRARGDLGGTGTGGSRARFSTTNDYGTPVASVCHRKPASRELEDLDVSAMTPLEAISKLYELQKRVKDD